MSDFLEVEGKYRIDSGSQMRQLIESKGWTLTSEEVHEDHYFNHPVRDFAQTSEALRIRISNGLAFVTYKGPKLAGPIKARKEMEWSLSPGDHDGSKTRELWCTLGFHPVAVVKKSRQQFGLPSTADKTALADPKDILVPVIAIDRAEGLGEFVEIEVLCPSSRGVETARQKVTSLAQSLGLEDLEHRSYLRQWIEKNA